MIIDNPYAERRFLRKIEQLWSKFEALLNRMLSPEFNALNHVGSLAIFLLVVLTVTGIYLTIFYRPGTEAAYASVERISANWLGSLMRSIHRYASDALLLVVVLHAFKHLISDRFWGSRWLAWLSGWTMVVFTWFLGILGYWLVWDLRSQWLTEYLIGTMKGATAVTFLSADIASSTFAAFVIVLFLHIFLPIAFLGLVTVHVLRLARARWWSPRWLMALSLAGLVIVSAWLPAKSAAVANLDELIELVSLDAWYVGFLVLVERWGNLPFWGLAGLVIVPLLLLPWLARGRHLGPVVVDDPKCNGCALCAAECPYRAIEMRPRAEDDPSGYKLVAVVSPALCTGCGICVGTCSTMGIQLSGLPTKAVYQQGVLARAERQIAAGAAPLVVFTCQRQAALGSLPPGLTSDHAALPADGGEGRAPVISGHWQNPGGAESMQTLTCVLPCVGMLDPNWGKQLLGAGVKDIVLLTCPYDDCANREGPHWLGARLRRHRSLLGPALHWLENTPGDSRPLAALLTKLGNKARPSFPPALPEPATRFKSFPRLPLAGLALLLLTTLFGLALPFEFPAGSAAAESGQVRIVVEHHGNVKAGLQGSDVVLPEHASVDMAQIMGGERYPVLLRVWVDGQLVLDENHSPRGLRSEGKISGVDVISLPPGPHAIEVHMKDDDGAWRVLFSDSLQVAAWQIRTLVYDQLEDSFRSR